MEDDRITPKPPMLVSAVLDEVSRNLLAIEGRSRTGEPIGSELHDQIIMLQAMASRVRRELNG